ncbi:MAG: FAD:protein FMN transferase [Gammaproteobacteria bacterium]|nr:FAD:protein FMN transferase [Gammaproteobacteria bacterium]
MKLFSSTTLFLSLCLAPPVLAQWFKDEQAIMGTSVNVELWDDEATHAQACIDQVMAFMRHVDQVMSPFKPEAELYKLNIEAALHPVKVSPELFDVIRTSIYYSEISNGVFDVTFASVGYRYDFRNGVHPSEAQIAQDLDKIDYRLLKLDEPSHTIFYAKPGVHVDLGGIAKGWAVDRAIEKLQACGIHQAIVSAGGDSRILGDRRGRPWMIGIKDPRNPNASAVVIPLSDTAISTSGDYERYFMEDGKRYHHILNPRTGKPADACRSVTVIGPNATTTDGLTKPVFILGPEKGLAIIAKIPGVDAIVIDKNGKLHYSTGLMPPPAAASEIPATPRNNP